MREGPRNFITGIVSILALIGLAVLMMSFGELDPILHPRYEVIIKTDNAAGLRAGGAVEFNGVPVGVVHAVYMEQSDSTWPVRVIIHIDDSTMIPSNVEPFATSPLIGGSAVLQLLPPTDQSTMPTVAALPHDGSATIVGPIRGGFFAQITAQLDERMKPLVESLEKFNKLSDTYITLGENLNTLVEPQTGEALEGGAQPNIRTAVLKLNQALDEATQGLALAKDWLDDEQMRNDAESAIHNAKVLIDQASTAVEKYTKLAETLQTDADDLTKRLLPVADQLSVTLEEVRRLTKAATDGQGTVGALISNPDLYNNLNDAAIRLERTLVEVQLLVQKLKAEGVGIHF